MKDLHIQLIRKRTPSANRCAQTLLASELFVALIVSHRLENLYARSQHAFAQLSHLLAEL